MDGVRYVRTHLSCILLYYADKDIISATVGHLQVIKIYDGPQWPKHVVSVLK